MDRKPVTRILFLCRLRASRPAHHQPWLARDRSRGRYSSSNCRTVSVRERVCLDAYWLVIYEWSARIAIGSFCSAIEFIPSCALCVSNPRFGRISGCLWGEFLLSRNCVSTKPYVPGFVVVSLFAGTRKGRAVATPDLLAVCCLLYCNVARGTLRSPIAAGLLNRTWMFGR